MSRFRTNPAAELTRRLRRTGSGADALPDTEEQRRRLIGSQSLAVAAALAAAGGGDGGGGNHHDGLGNTGGSIYVDNNVIEAGGYPYWSDGFEDGTLDGWTVQKGAWSEAGGLLVKGAASGFDTYRGNITFDASAGVADIEAFATLAGANVNNSIICARLENASNPTGYGVRYASGVVQVVRLAGTVAGAILADYTVTLSTGDVLGIRCHRGKIYAVVNGATVAVGEDLTHTAGLCGIVTQGSATPSFDDWGTR